MAEGKNEKGTFCAVNTGKIKNCYSYLSSSLVRSSIPFSGKDTGDIRLSFLNEKGTGRYIKNALGRDPGRSLKSEKDAREYGFDTEKIWVYKDEKLFLCFREENWKTKQTIPDNVKPISVKNESELFRFAELVNSGDKRVRGGYLRLEADLDLKNQDFVPIGRERQNAFSGVFDGNGHTISNIRVRGKEIGNYGFFGYLKGSVINLSLDISVKGEGNIGGLAAVNEGFISCCGVVSNLSGKGERLSMGGLCARNSSVIERCYSSAVIKIAPVPVIPISIMASGVALLGTVAFLAIPAAAEANDTIYAPIVPDKEVVKIKSDEEATVKPSSGTNKMSFQFNETLHVDPKDGSCYINLSNPSYSTNKLVAKLLSGDDESVMAQTGGIEPGYGLSSLQLNDNGYDKINAGIRNGYILLTAYNNITDDKAMVDSKLPVTIVVD